MTASGIDAGEGLVVRVFEQRRRTCSDGALDHFEERLEVAEQTLRQTSAQEGCEDLFVGRIAQRKRIELVLVHELVEDVGAEHDGLGDAHARLLLQFLRGFVESDVAQEAFGAEVLQVGVPAHEVVEEGEAASLAAERAIADACKVGILVEASALEHGHHALVLHATIGDDGLEDPLAVCLDVLQTAPRDALEEVGHGEEGT